MATATALDLGNESKPLRVGPETEVPGYRNYVIFCDESGIDGAQHYGFGSIWMPWERRGDFAKLMRTVMERHRYTSEIKWNRVCKEHLWFFRDLVRTFFETKWLMFHCLVVRKGDIDKTRHDGDYDLARQKHFTMLLRKKIEFFAKGCTDKTYRIRVDPIASHYAKADEVVQIVGNNQLRQQLGYDAIHDVIECDSEETLGIQLADLLVGAVVAAWNGKVTSIHKQALQQSIAEYVGWTDLQADMRPDEWKFNVWYFWDPTCGGPRRATTREVNLKIPLPKWRSSKPVRQFPLPYRQAANQQS